MDARIIGLESASERGVQLLEQNKQMHARGCDGFNGSSLIPVICDVGVALRDHHCTSVLDYGCGRGDVQRHFNVDVLWGVRSYCGYDPCVEAFPDESDGAVRFVKQLPPERFDAVICTDVLEHIPEEDLHSWVLDELFSKAIKLVFIKVPTWKASKVLPNGENAHCTVKPKDWWEAVIRKFSNQYGIPTCLRVNTTWDGHGE